MTDRACPHCHGPESEHTDMERAACSMHMSYIDFFVGDEEDDRG